MESIVTLVAERLSHGEMIKLQGVSVQYKDIVDGIGDQLCDCLAEEWTEHMGWAIALPCENGDVLDMP